MGKKASKKASSVPPRGDRSESQMLNPNAPAFVPSYVVTDDEVNTRIDDAMAFFHHLTTVNDSEALNEAAHWLGLNPDEWFANGIDYLYPDGSGLDEVDGYFCDREDILRSRIYRAPLKPRGVTRARACTQHRR